MVPRNQGQRARFVIRLKRQQDGRSVVDDQQVTNRPDTAGRVFVEFCNRPEYRDSNTVVTCTLQGTGQVLYYRYDHGSDQPWQKCDQELIGNLFPDGLPCLG